MCRMLGTSPPAQNPKKKIMILNQRGAQDKHKDTYEAILLTNQDGFFLGNEFQKKVLPALCRIHGLTRLLETNLRYPKPENLRIDHH